MSPKVVNGSFAAIYDNDEFLAKAYSGIRISVNDVFHWKLLLCFISLVFCLILSEPRFASHETKGAWYSDERKTILFGLSNGSSCASFKRQ